MRLNTRRQPSESSSMSTIASAKPTPSNNDCDELGQTIEAKRHAQQAFIARGLASLEAAKASGEYVSSDEVLRKLDEIITSAEKKAKK